MPPAFAAIPLVLVGTGLRPEELFALERHDVDLEAGVLSVERVYSQRVLKEPKKSSRQRRRVPLRARVVEALRAVPPRLDTPLLFAGTRGGHIDDNKWRWRGWTPALRAAGIEHRRIYDCRHTFASWAIAGEVQLFYLARIMGTSVAQIDATYGHLLPPLGGVPPRAAGRFRHAGRGECSVLRERVARPVLSDGEADLAALVSDVDNDPIILDLESVDRVEAAFLAERRGAQKHGELCLVVLWQRERLPILPLDERALPLDDLPCHASLPTFAD
jgi:hypothetical protein